MAMAISGAVLSIIMLIACNRAQSAFTEGNIYETLISQMLAEERSYDITSSEKGVIKTPVRADPSDFLIFPFNEMPTVPASEPWGDMADMDAMMRDLYQCGFNAAAFIETKYLKHARENHLMGMLLRNRIPSDKDTPEIADSHINRLLSSITDSLDMKAVHSIFLCDEPKMPDFPLLKIWTDAIKRQNVIPYNVIPYINLFSSVIESTVIPDYDEYLNQYIEYCDPSHFSYHYYPFKLEKVDVGGVSKLERVFRSKQFYSALEKMREKSQETGIPFWNVILSIPHLNLAETTEETLALQVYSALAYGSKGIGHFTYYTSDKGNYRHGAIDRFGHRTPTWDLIRNINLQIHSIVPIYKDLKSVNVFHTETIPGNGDVSEYTLLVDSVKGYSAISDNAPLLVGEFENPIDNKPYAIVVNKDIEFPVVIKFKFKGYETDTVVVVSQANQLPPLFQGYHKYLSPGSGVLLTIK